MILLLLGLPFRNDRLNKSERLDVGHKISAPLSTELLVSDTGCDAVIYFRGRLFAFNTTCITNYLRFAKRVFISYAIFKDPQSFHKSVTWSIDCMWTPPSSNCIQTIDFVKAMLPPHVLAIAKATPKDPLVALEPLCHTDQIYGVPSICPKFFTDPRCLGLSVVASVALFLYIFYGSFLYLA